MNYPKIWELCQPFREQRKEYIRSVFEWIDKSPAVNKWQCKKDYLKGKRKIEKQQLIRIVGANPSKPNE